jgi:bcr-type benzoyl-CoA reductase subunit C
MNGVSEIDLILGELAAIAGDPHGYAAAWKRETGRKVIGVFPMNFPSELVHAAGALPLVVQEDDVPITLGRSLLYEFYCGYTRSIVDQAATRKFDVYDAFYLVDHCVALLGAADALRFEIPEKPVFLAQYTASMDEAWTPAEIRKRVEDLRGALAEFCDAAISDDDLAASIAAYNRNRGMLRQIYALRRSGRIALTGRQMQILVKSSMVMEIEAHSERLAALLPLLETDLAAPPEQVKLHLSGHFCHAPRPELLDMIEDCGTVIVDDDLFTGFRFIATDVPTDGDPVAALTRWYFDRNTHVPCSTRSQMTVDWEDYLTRSVHDSGAEGVIILLAKFCEPHMLYYPELRKELMRSEIPHLLIETEHEGLALEMLRTRVEALLETIRLRKLQPVPA